MDIKEMIDVNFRGNIYIVQNGKVLSERENGFAGMWIIDNPNGKNLAYF